MINSYPLPVVRKANLSVKFSVNRRIAVARRFRPICLIKLWVFGVQVSIVENGNFLGKNSFNVSEHVLTGHFWVEKIHKVLC